MELLGKLGSNALADVPLKLSFRTHFREGVLKRKRVEFVRIIADFNIGNLFTADKT